MRVWGLSVGLASDVAGGPELNPWEVMKAAAYGHRARSCFVPETLIPSQVELFHLGATEAARVLGQEKTLGQLKSGYSADLVLGRLESYAVPSESPRFERSQLDSLSPHVPARPGPCRQGVG